jgi:hypothetical protein
VPPHAYSQAYLRLNTLLMSEKLYLVTPEQLEEIQFQNELGWVKQRSELSQSVTELEYRLRRARDSICNARRLMEQLARRDQSEISKYLWDAYVVLVRYEPSWI